MTRLVTKGLELTTSWLPGGTRGSHLAIIFVFSLRNVITRERENQWKIDKWRWNGIVVYEPEDLRYEPLDYGRPRIGQGRSCWGQWVVSSLRRRMRSADSCRSLISFASKSTWREWQPVACSMSHSRRVRGERGGTASAGSDDSPAATGPSAAGPCTCATICGSVGGRKSISQLAAVIISIVTHLIGLGDEQGQQ